MEKSMTFKNCSGKRAWVERKEKKLRENKAWEHSCMFLASMQVPCLDISKAATSSHRLRGEFLHVTSQLPCSPVHYQFHLENHAKMAIDDLRPQLNKVRQKGNTQWRQMKDSKDA